MENLLGAGGRNIWVTQKLNDKSKVRHHCESLPLVMIMTTVERMLDVEELWRQRTEEEEEDEEEEEEREKILSNDEARGRKYTRLFYNRLAFIFLVFSLRAPSSTHKPKR